MRKENKSTTNRFFWLRNEVFPLLDAPRNDQNAAVKKPPVSIDGGLPALAGTRPRRRAHAGTVARAPPRGPRPHAPAVRPVPRRPHTPALLVHAALPALGRVACYAAPAHAWPRSALRRACVRARSAARSSAPPFPRSAALVRAVVPALGRAACSATPARAPPRRRACVRERCVCVLAQQRSSTPSCPRSALRPAPPRPPTLGRAHPRRHACVRACSAALVCPAVPALGCASCRVRA
jgi:hypothetical protein